MAEENSKRAQASLEEREGRLARTKSLVTELLEQLEQDKPEDPIHFITQKLANNGLNRSASTDFDSPTSPNATTRCPNEIACKPLSITVLGASGDLAKKKTFPALYNLWSSGLLPHSVRIVGYARSELSVAELKERCKPFLPKNEDADIDAFFDTTCSYTAGAYDSPGDFANLEKHLKSVEASHPKLAKAKANRVFYLALPPTAFVNACSCIKSHTMAPGWTRVVVEKPFGRDTESSAKLAEDIRALFTEEQIYRIDHYLGKEMVQNLVTVRFANHVFNAVWSNKHISNVQITFKETIGTQGRGGYFDKFGIIRDVMQNHLTQILALIAMDKPKSLSSEHIRDEKVAVLRHVLPVTPEDCVIGQYTAKPDGTEPGYLEDPGVPKDSKCPTFASMILHVKNDRWDGVPFIMKAGKGMNEKVVLIRIQFKDEILPFGDKTSRNELVIRAQPDEAMYMKIGAKDPGLSQGVHMTELDLTYRQRYDARLPDAYESLINEVILGNSTNFVRTDELDAAWRIFTPLLQQIDTGKIQPTPYAMGTRGPAAADELSARSGYVRTANYSWSNDAQR